MRTERRQFTLSTLLAMMSHLALSLVMMKLAIGGGINLYVAAVLQLVGTIWFFFLVAVSVAFFVRGRTGELVGFAVAIPVTSIYFLACHALMWPGW